MLSPELRRVKQYMTGFAYPWCVAGGWALDLYATHQSREHGDVEVAVLQTHSPLLWEYLVNWSITKAQRSNGTEAFYCSHERVSSPPHGRHFIGFEVVLEESRDDRWVYKHCNEVWYPLNEVRLTVGSMPFLCPEIVLLYKAEERRPVDEQDFHTIVSKLEISRQVWLGEALRLVYGSHPWLDHLGK